MNASISIENLSLSYHYHDHSGLVNKFTGNKALVNTNKEALSNINLSITDGDRIGLIGKNGSGKTTLLKLLAGILTPTSGTVTLSGQVSSLLSIQAGFNPNATGYENIFLRGYIMGWTKKRIKLIKDEIIDFCELGENIYRPYHSYSSGMKMRLAFAMATTTVPDILLMDEWIGVADETFRAKANERIKHIVDKTGILVIASHNKSIIEQYTNKVVTLNNGKVVSLSSEELAT